MMSEVDADVVTLTFDGAPCNIKTARLLGAEIWDASKMNGSFKHPVTGRPLEILLDICHMLKLVRNTFGNKGFLYDSKGDAIKWDYIVKLNHQQQKEGLHAANKLTSRHIDYQSNKMSIKLAAQTLSQRVADALKLSEGKDYGYGGNFDWTKNDLGPTIKFLEVFNNLFDVLNSRNWNGHSYHMPLSETTKEKYFQFLDEAAIYIRRLQIDDPIVNKKKKTITQRRIPIIRSRIPSWN